MAPTSVLIVIVAFMQQLESGLLRQSDPVKDCSCSIYKERAVFSQVFDRLKKSEEKQRYLSDLSEVCFKRKGWAGRDAGRRAKKGGAEAPLVHGGAFSFSSFAAARNAGCHRS
ncbi:hypothetical protein ACLD0W_08855 [Alloalcanivorax sp. C16-1]|uniref:hypothetical protein n=1 Tax=Alloalcanivorax sp. C16-1 TaxID=3390051 RepID=UPI0039707932